MTWGQLEFAEALKPAIAIAIIAPMHRMGTSQEIVDTCQFLCSSKATLSQGTVQVSFHSPIKPIALTDQLQLVDGGDIIN